MNRLGVLILVLPIWNCAMKRVPDSVLKNLSYESKIELLESENELGIAIDHLDESQNHLLVIQEKIKKAKERMSDAKNEIRAAQDSMSIEVATLAVTEASARVEWLRVEQRLTAREVDVSEKNLECALARHEWSKLAVAKKAKLEGSERLNEKEFEQQVETCLARVSTLNEDFKTANTEAAPVRESWEQAKTALAKKTFDARASPFVE